MMPADVAARLVRDLRAAGVATWVDGGWGVDALLRVQTRQHDDLDLVIGSADEATVRVLLAGWGYVEHPTRFTTGEHTVWRNPELHEIDLHVVTWDADGNGVFGSEAYPAAGLLGRGEIAGEDVACITAEVQLEFHLGYEHDDDDRADVMALCKAFGLEVPQQYR